MVHEHLTRELFRSIHKGWRNPGDLAAIAMAHLFELCPRCRQEFESWRGELEEDSAGPESPDFDEAVDRVRSTDDGNGGGVSTSETRADAERSRARCRAEELLALPAEDRLDWIREEQNRHSDVLLAEVLIEECRRRTPAFPYEGFTLAHLARVVLQHAPTSNHAVELYALALARLANALRVIGDLPRADQTLVDARYLLRSHGGGDRLTRAQIDSLEASLRMCQIRPNEAIPLLVRMHMTLEMDRGNREAKAACLMKLWRAHLMTGDIEASLEMNHRARSLLAGSQDLALVRLAGRQHADTLGRAGRTDEAWEVIDRIRSLYVEGDDPLEALRLSWTEASIFEAMSKREAADELLVSVRKGFGEKDLRYTQAEASLELAESYWSQGRTREAEPLVEEVLVSFRPLGIPTKLARAAALLQKIRS